MQRLQQLEEQSKLWRQYYDEEEQRIELEYARSLAEIEEEFQDALRKIRSDFHSKREAVKRQYSGEGVSEKTKSSSQCACTTGQQCIPSTHQSAPTNVSTQRSEIQTIPPEGLQLAVRTFVSSVVDSDDQSISIPDRNRKFKSTGYSKLEIYHDMKCSLKMETYEVCVKKCRLFGAAVLLKENVLAIFDPGGKPFNKSYLQHLQTCVSDDCSRYSYICSGEVYCNIFITPDRLCSSK